MRGVLAATASTFRTDIYDLAGPMPTFRRGRTVLLGDAAHAMTPDLGYGAGQAMEDAATLTRLLGDGPTDAALDAYDRLRRARAQPIAARARQVGRIMQSRSPPRPGPAPAAQRPRRAPADQPAGMGDR